MKAKAKKSKTGHRHPVPKRKTLATVIKQQASEIRKLKKQRNTVAHAFDCSMAKVNDLRSKLESTEKQLEEQTKLVAQYKEFINTTIR